MKIMVSVVNPEEAWEAVKGGAEIIDVKNPAEGALGANLPWITRRIKESVDSSVEVSATIGDMPYLPGTASLAALGASLLKIDYVKIGMFGPKTPGEALKLSQPLVQTLQEFKSSVKVVVAGYADYKIQGCVNPLKLPQVAYEAGAWGLLIDVKDKNAKGLFDHLSFDELKKFIDDSRSRGLKTALAGSLSKRDVEEVLNLDPDIMGVRRGVCVLRNGDLEMDRNKVGELVDMLRLRGISGLRVAEA